ncbi:helix-turn-helix domain-containing protein [Mycobacterium sp. MUNTM1]
MFDFPRGHPVIQAQKTLFAVLADDRADFGVYLGNPRSARAALADIKALATRILAYAADNGPASVKPPHLLGERINQKGRSAMQWRYRRNTAQMKAPQIAAEAALATTAALSVLQAPTVTVAADRVRWLVEGRVQTGSGPAIIPYARDGGLVSAVLLKVFAPNAGSSLTGAHMQLRYRTTLPEPKPPEPGNALPRGVARSLPSMLWPNWSIRLRIREMHFGYLRCVLSCATVLVGSGINVDEAIALLGNTIDTASAKNALFHLQRSPNWAGVCTALTRLSEYLADHPTPINYARRRRLDYATLLPGDRWAHICRQTGALPGKGRGQKALIARCHLYEKLSSRPAWELLGEIAPSTRIDMVQRIANFPRRVTPDLARLLDDEARKFLHSNRIHEPITWTPPLELISDLDLPYPDPARIKISKLQRLAQDPTLSLTEIAKRLSTSTHTVRYLLDQNPIQPGHASLVETARAQVCPRLTAAVLDDLYVEQGRTLAQIAAQFKTNKTMVRRLLVRDGLPVRRRPPPPNAEWLYEQHVIKRRTLEDIASETGVRWRAVCEWKRRYQLASQPATSNLSHRPMSQTSALKLLKPVLTADKPSYWLSNFAQTLSYPTMMAAAAGLRMNPATLRYRIRALETIFDGPLLLRARHGMSLRPTPLGDQVAEATRHLSDFPAG